MRKKLLASLIGLIGRGVDRLTVAYLSILRSLNGSRSHVRCRRRAASATGPTDRLTPGAVRQRIATSDPPQVQFDSQSTAANRVEYDLRYPSPFPTGLPENDTVRCIAWTHKEPGANPSVIVLHGWMMSHFRGLWPIGETMFSAGQDVYYLELPYHMRRRVPGSFSGECFYGGRGEHAYDAVVQSVFDVSALIRWLKSLGSDPVGVYGVSLGGLIALLAACYSSDVRYVIANSPACCLPDLARESLLARKLAPSNARPAPARESISLRCVEPTMLKPIVPPERVAIIVATNDLIVPPKFPLHLADLWHGVRLWRYPHGHITVNLSRKLRQDVRRFVAGAAEASVPEPGVARPGSAEIERN